LAQVRVCARAAAKGTDTPEIDRKAAGGKVAHFPLRTEEAEVALCEYIREVLDAKLSEWKTNELVDKADYFMSWLRYEFTPGSHKG